MKKEKKEKYRIIPIITSTGTCWFSLQQKTGWKTWKEIWSYTNKDSAINALKHLTTPITYSE